MKIFYYRFTPLWGFILIWLVTIIGSLIVFAMNLYLGIATLIFIIIVDWYFTINMRKYEKWLKNTMENDSFIQKNNFNFGFVGMYSISLISKNMLRVIVHKTNTGNGEISDVYTNFPRQGTEMILNGVNVYYFDLLFSEIKSIKPEEGFGVKLETIDGVQYQLDTFYSHLFCSEINQNLSNSLVEKSPIILDAPTSEDRKISEIENIKNLTKADDIANRKQSKKTVKLIVKIILYAILIPVVSLTFLVVMNEFSKNVHWTTATGISVVGILFFFLSKYLKKKEDLYITEKLGAITLSSPLYIDLFSILSIVFIISGIFLNYDIINSLLFVKDETLLSGRKNLLLPKVIIGAIALFFYYLAYRRLSYSMFDKIVISQEEICIDDPRSNDLIQLSKKDIIKIVEVVVRNSKKNKTKSKKIVIYAFKEEVETTYDLDESYLSEMSISYNLFVNSLKKVGYVITN
jgi:hypothetical protein